MSAYPKFRDLHLYAGLLLGLPLVVIALTGVMLNHSGRLGLKPAPPGKALPAAGRPEAPLPVATAAAHRATLPPKAERVDAAANMEFEHQPASLGDQGGAFTSRPGGWQAYASAVDAALAAAAEVWGEVPLERVELKQEAERGMVIKVKAAPDPALSDREITWSVAQAAIIARKGPPHTGDAPIDWQKVVHDLHTGKFFSRTYGYWWSDVAGVALVLLGLTGGVLYAIPLVKKRQKRRAAPTQVRAALPSRHPSTPSQATSAEAAPPPAAEAARPLGSIL